MQLTAALTAALGREVIASSERRVSGGSINSSVRFDTDDGPIFVKHGDASCLPMFQAEADGLAELAVVNAVRIPDGDRETDLAMTRLFGGFHAPFYAAYQAAWPLDAGAEVRVTLYNLYHVLNHFNLFGGGYLRQALAMIQRLLAEVGH